MEGSNYLGCYRNITDHLCSQLYFKEIQPTLELFPSQLYNWLLNIVSENERDLGLIHPVLPDQASADPPPYNDPL